MMKLTHVCILTRDMEGLKDFYAKALDRQAVSHGEEYAEFPTDGGATISLFDADAMEKFSKENVYSASNESVLLEIEVEDLDAEYARIEGLDAEIVQTPADYPWGVRSFSFRDPDGNVVVFYKRLA